MVDSPRYKDWIDKARRDIATSKVLKDNDCGNDYVAFHCQQSIEKALKGFLLKEKGHLVEGYSLIFLCKEASKTIPELKAQLKDCAFVNQYYIETRYPADSSITVSDEDATECLEIAQKIFDIISKNI